MEIPCEVKSQTKIKSFLIPNTKIKRKEKDWGVVILLNIKICQDNCALKLWLSFQRDPVGFFFILYNKIVFLSKFTQWLRDRFNLSIHTFYNEHDFTLEWSLKLKSI